MDTIVTPVWAFLFPPCGFYYKPPSHQLIEAPHDTLTFPMLDSPLAIPIFKISAPCSEPPSLDVITYARDLDVALCEPRTKFTAPGEFLRLSAGQTCSPPVEPKGLCAISASCKVFFFRALMSRTFRWFLLMEICFLFSRPF